MVKDVVTIPFCRRKSWVTKVFAPVSGMSDVIFLNPVNEISQHANGQNAKPSVVVPAFAGTTATFAAPRSCDWQTSAVRPSPRRNRSGVFGSARDRHV